MRQESKINITTNFLDDFSCLFLAMLDIYLCTFLPTWMSHGPLSLLNTLHYYCIVSPVQDYLGSEMGDSFVLALGNILVEWTRGATLLSCIGGVEEGVGRNSSSIATKHVQFIFHLPIFPAENRKHWICMRITFIPALFFFFCTLLSGIGCCSWRSRPRPFDTLTSFVVF